jgi:hypothetical protein
MGEGVSKQASKHICNQEVIVYYRTRSASAPGLSEFSMYNQGEPVQMVAQLLLPW